MSFCHKINLERLRRPITKEVLFIQSDQTLLPIFTIEQRVLVEVHNPYSVHLLKVEKKWNLKTSCADEHWRKPKEIAFSGSHERSMNFWSLLTLACSTNKPFCTPTEKMNFWNAYLELIQCSNARNKDNKSLNSSNLALSNINYEGIRMHSANLWYLESETAEGLEIWEQGVKVV